MPEHGLVRLLELQKEGLEIVEVQIEKNSPAAGSSVADLSLPDGSRIISVFRHGRTELAEPGTVMRPGDQVLAIVSNDSAPELRRVLLGSTSVGGADLERRQPRVRMGECSVARR